MNSEEGQYAAPAGRRDAFQGNSARRHLLGLLCLGSFRQDPRHRLLGPTWHGSD